MEQERKFTIADVIATVGEDGTIQLPPQILEVLGINPGQSIHFKVDEKGEVTVIAYKSSKKSTGEVTAPEPIIGDQIEQVPLFDIPTSTTETSRRHDRRRQQE